MFKLMISWCCIIVVCKGNVFDNLLDEFWQWRMRNNPEFASNVGNSNYTDLLEDYSIAAIDTRKEWLEDFLTRVKSSVQRNSLDAGDSVTYDVLVDTIQSWLDGYEWRYYGPMNPISILEGIQITYGSRAELVKFESTEIFEKFATRIKAYGDQIDQIITRMKKSLEMKTTYHSVSISSVPADLDKMLVFEGNITGFPMYEPFRSKLDEKEPSSTVRAMIRAKAEQNIGYLLGQVRTLKDFISSTYIPNVRTTLGVLGLPRGKEYYRACLKWQLSTDITPQEIHDLGLERVNITYMEMENITRKAGFNGTVQEYFAQIKADDSNYERDPDRALQMFKDIKKERVDPVLHNLFEDIPPNITHMKIEKMTYNGPLGIYKNGAPDGSRPGVFYANVNQKVLKMEIPALLSHETDPGHHLQDAYALTSPSIPIFRRATDFTKYFAVPLHFPFYTAYMEGWGFYSEDLGEKLGMYHNDKEKLGQLSLEILRAARLVVDTGIHNMGWNKEQAVNYMLKYTTGSRETLEREVDRYSTWPGQATSYMIGKLKILELRLNATNETCGHLDIKKFHSVILKNGAMPLSIMEKLVKQYIRDTRAAHNLPVDTRDCLEVAAAHQQIPSCVMLICSFFMVLTVKR
ncbi:uncharacterized protein LOC128244847 [Mya arenaria]|uniref:uncharacterized protein LOC128244847 n=2 Tax=Mya arenaria TaxID=6604 RepID=UPI0022E23C22|nr:uncharacterized protein LOC128244847 [Mya arenaria]